MNRVMNFLVIAAAMLVPSSAMAEWQLYKNVTLDGYENCIPGGSVYNEVTVPTGGYRFRIDPTSVGVDYATNETGNTLSKSAALMIYDRTSTIILQQSVSTD